ncbi:MAG: secondary thiamine-phosphate synthase [Gammaproteobacteria bacterium]|nr:secondary thiamine-phosphate synthase [Gammaproteobacteria bacterium]
MIQNTLKVNTSERGIYDIGDHVKSLIKESGINKGICNLFIQHTSASLILCENADPAVKKDLETFMVTVAPDGDPMFTHVAEGPDDMPAHIRSILTQSDLNIPVTDGSLALGTWQGIFLWEHRHKPQRRKVIVTINNS